ncbi:MAG: DNA-directed RNA polymerase subunit omega [Clostridia bacterium]|nr:DNA-directed RNA polymerase subunit omega [Clostridia bacterium]
MIVKPTVNELLEHAENRYSLVIATSKRARQIALGAEAKTDVDEKSPVTIAANEIVEGKIKIKDIEKDSKETSEEQVEGE